MHSLHLFHCNDLDATTKIKSLCLDIGDNNHHIFRWFIIKRFFYSNIHLLILRNHGLQSTDKMNNLEKQDSQVTNIARTIDADHKVILVKKTR